MWVDDEETTCKPGAKLTKGNNWLWIAVIILVVGAVAFWYARSMPMNKKETKNASSTLIDEVDDEQPVQMVHADPYFTPLDKLKADRYN